MKRNKIFGRWQLLPKAKEPLRMAAVKLAFTVGGTEAAKDLFGLFDDMLASLLAAGKKR